MATFFVPKEAVKDGFDDEAAYQAIAKVCDAQPLPRTSRIESIQWVANGEEWTAEVGRTLSGRRTRQRQRQGRKVDVTEQFSDPAMVLAIFEGPPCFLVATDRGEVAGRASVWSNPIMAGQPFSVRRFD